MGFYTTRTKGITAFLILAMLLSLFSSQTMVANATESEDKSSFLLASDIPEAISSDVILSSNHISRIFEKEADLNTVVFSNADDTATMYYFAEPIKYVTDTGVVKDKSNQLYSTFDVVGYAEQYAYANLDNDIRTFFPQVLSSSTGVLLSTADIEIELLPLTDNASDVEIISDSNRAVRYNNAFGDGTTLRYSALFSGFKEDIILDNNVGNVYKFLLKANGLQAMMRENAIYLVEPDAQTEVAYINPVYVYDSFTGDVDGDQAHSTYNNTIDLISKDNGDYEITITVDNEFLNNADIVYPVYVDPTITINTTGSGSSKTIQDAPIYNGSGAQSIASGSDTTAVIGYVGTQSSIQYGAGRLLMKFPGLRNNATFLKLNADTISAATLYLRELSGQSSSATIGAYLYTGTAWTETGATYNNTTWNGYGTLLGTASVGSSSATTVSFNIKGAMAGWISSATTADKGIMLKNNTSESSLTYYKSFYSTEGTTKPYVSVTYTWYGCKSYRSVTSSSINCQGYAFYINDWPVYMTSADANYCATATLANALARTKTCMTTWLNANFPGKWAEVSSYSTTLADNQWIITMRVGNNAGSDNYYPFDYHYWYRTNDGSWANKHGGSASEKLPASDTPTTNSSSGWKLDTKSGYYNSSIVYYVVTE